MDSEENFPLRWNITEPSDPSDPSDPSVTASAEVWEIYFAASMEADEIEDVEGWIDTTVRYRFIGILVKRFR